MIKHKENRIHLRHKHRLGEETESINGHKDSLIEETRNRRDGQDRTKQRGSFKASFRKTRATNELKGRLRKRETGHKGLVEGKIGETAKPGESRGETLEQKRKDLRKKNHDHVELNLEGGIKVHLGTKSYHIE